MRYLVKETFKEYAEGWVGGAKGSRPHQRNELFSTKSLREQYNQLSKAIECNRQRGALKELTD